ncbi:MAG: DNA-3-methyladenine glycosylase I [Pseudomonadota bacterium]
MANQQSPTRCGWCGDDPLYIDYHDHEWGTPQHDDQKLFEMLILEGAQAGLSWITILRKRQNYLEAFDQFDPEEIIQYDAQKIESLLQNPGIIRNKLKVNAVVKNARGYLQILEEFGSFDSFIWRYVDGKPIQNNWDTLSNMPASTQESKAMSKDLKKRGFSFVGETICYAYMQATGMVNDHITDCFRYEECAHGG